MAKNNTEGKQRPKRKNVLFILTDQQRADCLGVLGHPVIKTPNLDRLASKGTLFRNAFVQATPCIPSRACIDTGRYMHSHRVITNETPLPTDEVTMGTHFTNAGYRAAWIGKGYYTKDYYQYPEDPMPELLYDHQYCAGPPPGWENWAYDMGGENSPYAAYLKEKGYPEGIFKTGFGGLVETSEGERVHPFEFRAAYHPTVIKAEHSETAFFVQRAIDFIKDAKSGEDPWALQVNIFHPHSPFVAPAPYHEMYDPDEVTIFRTPEELQNMHPLHRLMRFEREGIALDSDDHCRKVRSVYYGMISEVDHQVGRILDYLEAENLMDSTMIVFSSDHGECMGDHWCIQKETWFDCAFRIPLIIYDPSPEANKMRGQIQDAFAGEIDILPTFMDACGMETSHAIEGRSLIPVIRRHAPPPDWPTETYGEWDFRIYWSMKQLGLRPNQCRMWFVRDHEFKYMYFNGVPHILYDLAKDPNEYQNVADDPEYAETITKYREKLLNWRMSTEDNSRVGWMYERRPKFGPNPFRFGNIWPEDHKR